MGLLQPAKNMQGYLKAGLLGFAGSGKTYTAGLLALGLMERLGSKAPVAFQDTENGADYLIPKFEAAGLELVVAKTRAFADMLSIVPEAQKLGCQVLIVDSITHIWRELCDSYCKKKGIRRLKFQHWADLKAEWQEWTDAYLNSPLHIIVCGRAGWIYEMTDDGEGGKDLVTTGTKMKVETEFGFEPSLLIEMVRVPRGTEPGAGWIHRAYVNKDRTDQVDGKSFDDPTLECFEPVLDALNIGGDHLAIDTSRTSEEMFDSPDKSRSAQHRQATIALEEIKETGGALWPSTSGKDKKAKIKMLEVLFDTKSWSAVEAMPLARLLFAVQVLKEFEKQATDETMASLDSTVELMTAIKTELQKGPISEDELGAFGAGGEAKGQ